MRRGEARVGCAVNVGVNSFFFFFPFPTGLQNDDGGDWTTVDGCKQTPDKGNRLWEEGSGDQRRLGAAVWDERTFLCMGARGRGESNIATTSGRQRRLWASGYFLLELIRWRLLAVGGCRVQMLGVLKIESR